VLADSGIDSEQLVAAAQEAPEAPPPAPAEQPPPAEDPVGQAVQSVVDTARRYKQAPPATPEEEAEHLRALEQLQSWGISPEQVQ
jgi:hypothetical protein